MKLYRTPGLSSTFVRRRREPTGRKDLLTPMNTSLCSFALLLAALSAGTPPALGAPQEESVSFKDAHALLKKYCEVCHNGGAPDERPVSQFDVGRVQEPSSLVEEIPLWKRVLIRVRDEE